MARRVSKSKASRNAGAKLRRAAGRVGGTVVGGFVEPYTSLIETGRGLVSNSGKRRKQASKSPDKTRKNPEALAEKGYEEFHGHPSKETLTVRKKRHEHRFLSGAGRLEFLKIRTERGKTIKLRFDKQTHLAFNERKNQLFVEGGDQSVNLKDFGIKEPHELETLGKAVEIGYVTDKSHLGDEGGKALYEHKFRTTNEDGRHVTVRIARYPDVIYRVLDQQIEFSGGSYFIRAEGIDL